MPASSTTPETDRYGINSLTTAIQVLKAIGEKPDQTVPQLAHTTGLTKSKIYRIIRTLEHEGLVNLTGNHAIRLGTTTLILGRQAESQFTLLQAAAPTLDHLAQETHENVYLLIREHQHCVVIDLRHSPHPVRTFARVGTPGALHAGGAAKVLLAYAPPETIDAVLAQPLKAFTPHTTTDPDTLRTELEAIRQHAFYEAISDLQDQVFALAVPIFDHTGQAVAAISVAGPLMRYDPARKNNYQALLQQGSRSVSMRLGATA